MLTLRRWRSARRGSRACSRSNARADRERDEQREADAEQRRRPALAAQRLDDRVGRVAPDQHQDEQEQDHDRAGVDDDLHEAEERALLDQVERAEAHHRRDQRERRVHGVAQQHHADRAGQRDRAEDPERDGLAERHLAVASRPGGHAVTSRLRLIRGCRGFRPRWHAR